MTINFPSSPSNNQLFVAEGKAMRYVSSKSKWKQVSTLTSSQITDLEARTVGVSSMSISGNTLVIQKDDSSYANVSLASFAGNKLTSYANASILPLSDLVSGTQVYVEDTDSLYITDGSGWYKIATVNLSPSLTLGVESISLTSGGSVDVNYTVNEPEDTPYTITASSTSNATITVYQANNTITFNSPVAATTETITITATDGVNSVGDTLTMTITLGPDWASGSLQTSFQGSDTAGNSRFGNALAISNDGNTVVSGDRQAAIFVHTRSGSTWSQQQKIVQSGVTGYIGHVATLSGDGDTVAFSDYVHDNVGEVYVWTRSGSTWSQEQIIPYTDADTDLDSGDRFGYALSLSDDGDTLVIGCQKEDQDGSNSGGAYVFTRSGSTWSFQQRLVSSPTVTSSEFGNDVAISGDGNYIIVGQGSGSSRSLYVFALSGGTWSQQAALTTSGLSTESGFGAFIDISQSGDTIIAGAPGSWHVGGTNSGAALIYTRSGSTWSQQAILEHSTAASQDNFGFDVSISNDGNTAIVGAYIDDISSATDAGSAFIFSRDGSTWTEEKELNSSTPTTDEYFGTATVISGDGSTAAVCAQGNATGGSMAGKVYIFTA